MICQPCRLNILNGSQPWGFHRPDYHNPNNDPELEKCTFCSQLRQDVKQFIRSPDAHQDYPTYRWAIRLSPVVRETQPTRYTAITFRPVQVADQTESAVAVPLKCRNSSSPPNLQSTAKPTPLPTRIFYIFDPTPLSIPSTLPPTTTVSPGAASQIHKWISTCLTSHPRCSTPPSSPFFPTRLLDISNPARPIYVLHTSPLHITTPTFLPSPYTTLSHCWGPREANPPMLRLTAATFGKFTNPSVGIPWDILPKTFQQAIEVARELGVKYIWIDSLCIVQWTSAEEPGDFKTEGQLMHKVYRYSYCNIAAVDSQFGGGGLFRGEGIEVDEVVIGDRRGDGKDGGRQEEKRERSKILPDLVSVWGLARPGVVGRGEDEKKYVVLQDIWNSELLSGMLYTRGWVFQERMLSPRLLHFSSTQIFFDCATTSACEILPDALPLPLDNIAATERHWREMLLATRDTSSSSSTDPTSTTRPPIERHQTGTADPSLETLWRTAVRKYTSCELTNYGSDRLAAIWGVAKLVRDNLRVDNVAEEYGAGLWRTRLEEQLAWRVVDYRKAERMRELSKWPSWSWASVRGEIEAVVRFGVERRWRVCGFDGGEVRMDVEGGVDWDLEPGLGDKKLGVRGVVVPGSWERVGCCLDGCGGNCEWTVGVEGGFIGEAARLHVYPDVEPGGETSCFLLVLALGQSLSARRAGGEDLEDGTGLILGLEGCEGGYKMYKRLGTFRVWGVDGDKFDAFHRQAVEDLYLV